VRPFGGLRTGGIDRLSIASVLITLAVLAYVFYEVLQIPPERLREAQLETEAPACYHLFCGFESLGEVAVIAAVIVGLAVVTSALSRRWSA